MLRWIVIGMLVLGCMQARGADTFQFTQPSGQYHVGFKVTYLRDASRSYRDGYDALTGEAVNDPPGRPIQALIWYPASAPGKTMIYADYLALAGSEERFADDPAQAKVVIAAQLREWIVAGATPDEAGRLAAETVPATRDAPPASGRFPLVIYAASDSSSAFENDVLCEYLASHGYVVIASPSHGAHVRYMTDGDTPNDLRNTRAQAADIGYLIGYAQNLPDVDAQEVGVVAYSWGGMSSAFAAANDGRIRALVDFDGSVRYFPALLAAAPDITPDLVQAPLLFFADQEDPLVPGKDAEPNSFIDRIHHADVTTVWQPYLTHDDLSSDSLRFTDSTVHGHATPSQRNAAYGWLVRYALAFLDATLRHDPQAAAFMSASPSTNHVPDGMFVMQHRGAQGSAPSYADFAHVLATSSFEQAIPQYAAYVKAHPAFRLTTDALDQWVDGLLGTAHDSQAVALARLEVRLFPASVDAWSTLGIACSVAGRTGEARVGFEHVLKLDPHNQYAVAQLKVLTAGVP